MFFNVPVFFITLIIALFIVYLTVPTIVEKKKKVTFGQDQVFPIPMSDKPDLTETSI